jgi:hypothetical protein
MDNAKRIVVNGEVVESPADDELTFEQIVSIAFPECETPEDYTVTYHCGNIQGSLSSGESVEFHAGTVFNAALTSGA